jgi:hypothetical protein
MSGLTASGDFWNIFGTSAAVGADSSYSEPRSTATVPTSALGSMQPVTAANDGGGWSDFWKGTLQTVIGYSIAKDAARSGVTQQRTPDGQPIYATAQRAPTQGGGAMPMGMLVLGGVLLGGVLLVALRK